MHRNMSDTLIIIPTYNEIENIEDILRIVFSLDKEYHVLIVCLLYTSDAADDSLRVDLGGRRIIKKVQHQR